MDRRVRSQWIIIIPFVVAFFLPRPAHAQERLVAGGLGAVTFGTVNPGSDFAARAGVNASRHVQLFGEVGRMSDVLPKTELQTMTDTAASFVASGGGTTSAVLGEVPATYALFGVRATGRTKHHVSPFGDVGYGFAHMKNDLTATLDGADISSQVLTTGLTSQLPQTASLLSLGGGISIEAGKRTAFDVGYRYSRIYATDEGINFGKLYGGVHVGF